MWTLEIIREWRIIVYRLLHCTIGEPALSTLFFGFISVSTEPHVAPIHVFCVLLYKQFSPRPSRTSLQPSGSGIVYPYQIATYPKILQDTDQTVTNIANLSTAVVWPGSDIPGFRHKTLSTVLFFYLVQDCGDATKYFGTEMRSRTTPWYVARTQPGISLVRTAHLSFCDTSMFLTTPGYEMRSLRLHCSFRGYRPLSAVALVRSYPRRGSTTGTP
ncbi:hypothetical protein EDB89DRAFT_1303960 [Lactarius sanguifluus]|nr:hypothetical protein EDB89DRAFT_1303960 [Lactarius sanguifluus]